MYVFDGCAAVGPCVWADGVCLRLGEQKTISRSLRLRVQHPYTATTRLQTG